MAANSHRAEVEFKIGGKAETMRGTFDCFARIEAATGHGSIVLARRLAAGEIGYTEAAIILTEGLRAGSVPDAKLDKVGGHLFEGGLANFMSPIADFLTAGLGGASEDKNPPKAGES